MYSLFLLILATLTPLATGIDVASKCPRECVCSNVPLRDASFVLTWMSSWGEDDLPDIHINDVINAGSLLTSETAADANVDVDVIGLHATCSIHPTTNVTALLAAIPNNTMVLSLLQAPGCSLTIVEGGDLFGLSSLLALHMQGYAHEDRQQVSGYSPNAVPEMIAHKKLLQEELANDSSTLDLRLFLAEDALQPLNHLQLLDLQYVRLVAPKDARRSRRYSTEPLSTTNLMDMPLAEFLTLTQRLEKVFHLPPEVEMLRDVAQRLDDEDEILPNGVELIGNSYKINRNKFLHEQEKQKMPYSLDNDYNSNSDLHFIDGDDVYENDDDYLINLVLPKDPDDLVPYAVYRQQLQPKLAPFQSLSNLKYLRAAHAHLDRIGTELLTGLKNLHTLTLEHNKIMVLPSKMFESTPNLRHLSLAHNNILTMDSESFIGLNKLLTMDLDYNKISILGPASLAILPSMNTLRFIGNPLTHLLADTFIHLNNTQKLFLGSSSVEMDLHKNAFRTLMSLDTLVLQNVSLYNLEKNVLEGIPRLIELTIHGNITQIDYDAFSNTILLEKLILSFCHIQKLSIDAFFGLNSLKKLDLSHNEIASLSPGIFDYLSNLRELYLHHNKLTTIPLGLFLPVPAKLIQLQENPWHCTCDLLQLRPSITNKIAKNGYVKCHYTDKLGTVCSDPEDHLVYDVRVAPLCNEPYELKGNDVYHAALRHLKCSKVHWDPRLLQSEYNEQLSQDNTLIVEELEEEDKDEQLSWLPLSAFTPEPILSKDLLNIAENENLEEAPIDNYETVSSTSTQNDQPLDKEAIKRNKKLKEEEYRKEKMRIKGEMRKKDLLRKEEKRKELLRREMKRQERLAEKKKIKSLMAAKHKKKHLKKNIDWKFSLNSLKSSGM